MKEDDQKDVENPLQKDARIRQEKSHIELEGIIDNDRVLRKLKVRPGLFELPDGFPEASIREFYTAQDTLQQRYTENKAIIKLMDIYDNWNKVNEANQWKKGIETTDKNFLFPPEIPSELRQEFANVCWIRREAGLGMDKRISSQLGDKAFGAVRGLVLSEGGRKAAKAKTGYKGPLRVAIERLVECLNINNLDSLLEVIEEAIDDQSQDESLLEIIAQDPDSPKTSLMIDLYFAEENPIDIFPESLDRNKKVFKFKERSSQKVMPVGFDRLRNILLEIKKDSPPSKK
jgi:hypothetical protein